MSAPRFGIALMVESQRVPELVALGPAYNTEFRLESL